MDPCLSGDRCGFAGVGVRAAGCPGRSADRGAASGGAQPGVRRGRGDRPPRGFAPDGCRARRPPHRDPRHPGPAVLDRGQAPAPPLFHLRAPLGDGRLPRRHARRGRRASGGAGSRPGRCARSGDKPARFFPPRASFGPGPERGGCGPPGRAAYPTWRHHSGHRERQRGRAPDPAGRRMGLVPPAAGTRGNDRNGASEDRARFDRDPGIEPGRRAGGRPGPPRPSRGGRAAPVRGPVGGGGKPAQPDGRLRIIDAQSPLENRCARNRAGRGPLPPAAVRTVVGRHRSVRAVRPSGGRLRPVQARPPRRPHPRDPTRHGRCGGRGGGRMDSRRGPGGRRRAQPLEDHRSGGTVAASPGRGLGRSSPGAIWAVCAVIRRPAGVGPADRFFGRRSAGPGCGAPAGALGAFGRRPSAHPAGRAVGGSEPGSASRPGNPPAAGPAGNAAQRQPARRPRRSGGALRSFRPPAASGPMPRSAAHSAGRKPTP